MRLPDPPSQSPTEPRHTYGVRLLLWLLADDWPTTATLSDWQLDTAHAATCHALARTIRLRLDEHTTEATPVGVYDRLETLRRLLGSTMRARAADATADSPEGVPVPVPPAQPPRDGIGGYRVPLLPVPIVRPPSGQKVEVRF